LLEMDFQRKGDYIVSDEEFCQHFPLVKATPYEVSIKATVDYFKKL